MMRRTIYTCYSLLLATVLLPGTISCTSRCGTVDESRLSYIDTRVGTAPSATNTAGLFGRDTEEYGQTLPGHGGEMHSTLLLRRYSAARLS